MRTEFHAALLQEREDAALGAAWQRLRRAVPHGFHIILEEHWLMYYARTFINADGDGEGRPGPTAVRALTALAEALEARKP